MNICYIKLFTLLFFQVFNFLKYKEARSLVVESFWSCPGPGHTPAMLRDIVLLLEPCDLR